MRTGETHVHGLTPDDMVIDQAQAGYFIVCDRISVEFRICDLLGAPPRSVHRCARSQN